ncbi:MAG: slipin family protein [Eubacteriales bacterium]|jgi:regulator of protease activity HflC (stomatin/prohibitin superfamily)|nr:slipin family protein [Bacillota bacterium]MBV1726641.1 slipin family protein [Desulforudis sp.]MDQ7790002.1 slipin family protein [Clostridia bacterium]MDZ4042819.1 slipin family protein [Eubacteriales bacterium]MBU4553749.1 slipin family protein [Bacillota bacterium]
MFEFLAFWGVIIAFVIFFFSSAIRIVQEYERGVIFRLGRFVGARGPGLFFIIPIIERMEKVDLRVVTADVPTQEAITRDNVTVKVNAVIYFRVVDPGNAVLKVLDHVRATSQLAQTTLRSVLGQSELDELLANRDQINTRLQKIIDEGTEPWGVKVSLVEVKDVELPQSLQRAMAAQASAERERRAKVIHADGEFQASAKLAEAAAVLRAESGAMQLRYLQTLTEISGDKSNTIVFPLPMDLINNILDRMPAPKE